MSALRALAGLSAAAAHRWRLATVRLFTKGRSGRPETNAVSLVRKQGQPGVTQRPPYQSKWARQLCWAARAMSFGGEARLKIDCDVMVKVA